MKSRSLFNVCCFALCVIITGLIVSAQDKGTEPAGAKKYKAVKGFVEVDSVKYPVFVGIKEVDASQFGGVTFALTQKNQKQALLMTEKIKRFYLGKKIGKFALPQFKKVSKPETIAWSSLKCGNNNEGAHAVVKVEENTVTVYLFASCDEGVLAQIL
jgi:hypothetical protein